MDGTAFWVVVVENSRNLFVVFVGFMNTFHDVVKHSQSHLFRQPSYISPQRIKVP